MTYAWEHHGKFFLIEHAPARLCRETGEQYFSPETVEHIQAAACLRMCVQRAIDGKLGL